MAPAWEELGTEYESSSSVVIGNVDCTVETELCGKYGVSGYPTLKYFTDGKVPRITQACVWRLRHRGTQSIPQIVAEE